MPLPPRLAQWLPDASLAGHHYGVDPALVLAILDRETLGGEACRPKGPTGTGDWAPRRWARYATRADLVGRLKVWMPTPEDFAHTFGPHQAVEQVCMPADLLGWGRGLMQLDVADPSNAEFLAELLEDGTPAWQDPRRNIDAGTRKLADLIRLFDHEEGLACAAYNAGPERVRAALKLAGPVTPQARIRAADLLTTGRNYATDVLDRRDRYARLLHRRNPESPPMTVDPHKTPLELPAARGIVGVAGKQPLPRLLDLNGDGIPDYEQKWFRDALAGGLFRLAALLFPNTPWALVLRQYEPEIRSAVARGAK